MKVNFLFDAVKFRLVIITFRFITIWWGNDRYLHEMKGRFCSKNQAGFNIGMMMMRRTLPKVSLANFWDLVNN